MSEQEAKVASPLQAALEELNDPINLFASGLFGGSVIGPSTLAQLLCDFDRRLKVLEDRLWRAPV